MSAWLTDNQLGSGTHTGCVSAEDRTVITPQADSNYGYCWFNISKGPLTVELPADERYSSLSIFDMNHFVEAVLVSRSRPVVVRLAGQRLPIEDAHEVVLQTICGLAFLRMEIPEAKDEQRVLDLTKQWGTSASARGTSNRGNQSTRLCVSISQKV